MHAPSALIAGAVLTFGATALANLYLPPANTRSAPVVIHEPVSAPVAAVVDEQPSDATSQPTELLPESPQPIVASDYDTPLSEMVSMNSIDPTLTAQTSGLSPTLADPSQASQPQSAEAAEETAPEPTAAAPVEEQPQPTKKKKPTPVPVKKPTAKSKQDAVSEQFAPGRPEQIFGSNSSATKRAESASVSAVLGTKAWVRLGDSRTVAVQSGDVVPNMGKVTSVSAEGVTFENGTTLRVQ